MSDEGCDGVKVKVGGGCCCVVLIASAIMVGCSFGVLDPTQFALDYDTVNFQIADGVLYTGGRHFIGLGHQFIIFPNTLQTVRMGSVSAGEGSDGETVKTSSLLARTEDGLQVTLDISFQYRLTADLEQIIKLYSDFQDNYRPAYVRIARNVLRDVASEFQAFQYFYNRTVVGAKMREVLNQALANHSAIVQAFQLLNVELPTRFSSAIEGTEVARQAIENARYQQDVARTEANTRVEEAKRQALIIALEANATAQSTTLQAAADANITLRQMQAETTAYRTIQDELAFDEDQLLSYVWLKAIQTRRPTSENVIGVAKPAVLEVGYQYIAPPAAPPSPPDVPPSPSNPPDSPPPPGTPAPDKPPPAVP